MAQNSLATGSIYLYMEGAENNVGICLAKITVEELVSGLSCGFSFHTHTKHCIVVVSVQSHRHLYMSMTLNTAGHKVCSPECHDKNGDARILKQYTEVSLLNQTDYGPDTLRDNSN